MENIDINTLLNAIIKWFNSNIATGSVGSAIMTLLKALGNLIIKVLEFSIGIIKYLIDTLQQILEKL